MADWVFGRLNAVPVWENLSEARVNYSVDEIRPPAWHIDNHRFELPAEPPGPPERKGSWERARRLVRDYEFSPPEIVRALYDPAAPLLGRNMLLEARFPGMHFYLGVRVDDVVDEVRPNGDRVWGWSYETLEGHLERGKVTYEVVKHQGTGKVEFVIASCSQATPTLDRITRLGWRLFGRRIQLRFYHRCGQRLRAFVEAGLGGEEMSSRRSRYAGHLVLAPSDVKVHRRDALTIHRVTPG